MIGEEFLTDDVYIVNKNGTKQGPFKTRFGEGKKLTLFDPNLEMDIEIGYKILRPLPNGKEMIFDITDYSFSAEVMDFPNMHNLVIDKAIKQEKPLTSPKSVVYNIHGSSGFQIGDHNVQNITNSFNELIERINSSDTSIEEKTKAKGAIKALLENPTVSSILGGAVSGLMTFL